MYVSVIVYFNLRVSFYFCNDKLLLVDHLRFLGELSV